MVSVIIPSRTEKFLDNTIREVLDNAEGEIEVFPVLDGYDCPRIDDRRVKYICIPDNGSNQKRQGINCAVDLARGKFVMALDAHCKVGKGFDTILPKDCQDNQVFIPRRLKVNAQDWSVVHDKERPVDYEYWRWDGYKNAHDLKAYRWNERGIERKDIIIDETLTMQASCWFMTKSWYKRMGFMNAERYTGWGQEDGEIALETWTNGGQMMVNKNTWYAHLFKGKVWGRMYHRGIRQYKQSVRNAYQYWCVERRKDFLKVIEKFMPIPNWDMSKA